jgi:hypothetical protein
MSTGGLFRDGRAEIAHLSFHRSHTLIDASFDLRNGVDCLHEDGSLEQEENCAQTNRRPCSKEDLSPNALPLRRCTQTDRRDDEKNPDYEHDDERQDGQGLFGSVSV